VARAPVRPRGFDATVDQYFSARGYDQTAVAGILGNSEQESTDNPNTPGGGAWQQISDFGSGTGGSLRNQMAALARGLAPYRGQLNAAGSPSAAALTVSEDYERPGKPDNPNRERYARMAAATIGARGGRRSVSSGTALSRMLAEANALIGYPYVWGGGHGQLGVPSGGPPAGFDCSGYWSAILGAGGYLTSPQTTAGLHTQGTLTEGPGLVTIYDRYDSDGQDHVIGNIAGTWYESGGTTSGGPHIMSAAAASAQLAQGGFHPYHPKGMTRASEGPGDYDTGQTPITRPGGGAPSSSSGGGGDDGAGVQAEFAAYETSIQGARSGPQEVSLLGTLKGLILGGPDIPLTPDWFADGMQDPFKSAATAIDDTNDFLKWVAWIFHPKNIVRAVEFLTGLSLMAVGLSSVMKGATGTGPVSAAAHSLPGKVVGGVAEGTVIGRTVKDARAVRGGRKHVKAQAARTRTNKAHQKGRAQQTKKDAAKALKPKKQSRRSLRKQQRDDPLPF
jgi:cell wall-associated NlpC family hydrolase